MRYALTQLVLSGIIVNPTSAHSFRFLFRLMPPRIDLFLYSIIAEISIAHATPKERMSATTGDSSSPLLGLPPAIRRQIYLELGVCTRKIIDLGLRIQRPCASGETIHLVRLKRRDFYTLLFICRTMYAELPHIIDSENSIIAQNSTREEAFQALHKLTAFSTSAHTSLTVHLNGALCCLYGCCGTHMDVLQIPCEKRGCKEPLVDSAPIDQRLLEDWWSTMDNVSANAKPFSLEF